ncbi:hypothetical protein CAC42_6760 [Sphaceloma murrayae]|uniref:Uncharacterized protein n=1 Tax=Sphaceloma murrayae TaxID=2082308 RepID=A0A2K1QGF8_9PEZI|nr:hypothetical protein CAC42_6760 [Sphaceloma murrayae]
MKNSHGGYPVTALATSDTWLFAGEGPYLRIYDRRSETLIQSTAIFSDTSIHGILLEGRDTRRILIWGASLVTVISVLPGLQKGHGLDVQVVVNPTRCPDWILEGRWSENRDEASPRAALVTAHNALLILRVDEANNTGTVEAATSQSKSILYCAALYWQSNHQIVVAGGTVFGQIVVWSAALGAQQVTAQLHKIFSGHEGSPFGLCFSDANDEISGNVRLLASCSDDRSVRIWDVSSLDCVAYNPQTIVDEVVSTDGDTGFVNHKGTNDHAGGLVAQAMGHASRIWAVSFLSQPHSQDHTSLVTFGEDASCVYWKLDSLQRDDSGALSGNLHSGEVQDRHAGKHIWSRAVCTDSSGLPLIITGGADGAIVMQVAAISRPSETTGAHGVTDFEQIVPMDSRVKIAKIRSYSFVTADELLVVTNAGQVCVARMPRALARQEEFDHNQLDWQEIYRESSLAGFSLTASVTSASTVFLTDNLGSLFCYRPDMPLSRLLDGERKAATLVAKPAYVSHDGAVAAVCLLKRLDDPVAELMELRPCSESNELLQSRAQAIIPPAETVSSFAILHKQLLIGFRSGTIALYNYQSGPAGSEPMAPSAPLRTLTIHTDAITDMASCPSNPAQVLVTSRSGAFSIHALPSLSTLHNLPVPSLSESSLVLPHAESYALAGFHRKSFRLYDPASETTLLSIPCGGSNRSWTFCAAPDGDGGTLVWTQASELRIRAARKERVRRIGGRGGGHGREIKAVAVRWREGGRVLATGAEDTDVKLHRIEGGGDGGGGAEDMRCVRTVRRHNTGIQDLAWTLDGRRLVSAGGCEEMFVWRVRPLDDGGLGVVCEGVCPFVSEGGELRIMSLALCDDGQCAGTDVEEMRMRIVAARSDSSVCVYVYEFKEGKAEWSWSFTGTYTSCCLMNVLPLVDGEEYLTMGTDGYAALMGRCSDGDTTKGPTGSLEMVERFKVHQSAVHTSSLLPWSEGTYLLFSGGDDNALSISIVQSRGNGDSTLTIPRAHAAALTALAVIDHDLATGKVLIVTAGLDQRIKLWSITVDAQQTGVAGLLVTKVEDKYLPVADVSSVCSWEDESDTRVMVCGVGWDVWKVARLSGCS